jgi:hypothetical protein
MRLDHSIILREHPEQKLFFPESEEAFIYIAMIRLMAKQLA